MRVERRPVHHGVTGAAVPAHMPAAAVPEAGDMPDEDLVRAEWVSVRATRRRAGHPLAIRRLKKIAQHNQKGKPICVNGFVHASLASSRAYFHGSLA